MYMSQVQRMLSTTRVACTSNVAYPEVAKGGIVIPDDIREVICIYATPFSCLFSVL
jgi:hypothetical protein